MAGKIHLNKRTYPLYVGGSAGEGFRDWDGKGSSVVLGAEVISETYGMSDIEWRIADRKIVDFDDREVLPEGSRRVRARRTGITTVSAILPDGFTDSCIITVIDNYSRFTVAEIILNTDELHLQKGKCASLIPILYPKDIFQNGMLDTALVWESDNVQAAEVQDGVVTAVGVGEARITVSSVDVGRTACCHVVVTEDWEERKTQMCGVEESVPEPVMLQVGDVRKLLPGTEGESSSLVWRSENRMVAEVDEKGCIHALSPSMGQRVDGTGLHVWEEQEAVRIYATDIDGGKVWRYAVMVAPSKVPVQELAVCPKARSIPSGETRLVTVTLNPSIPGHGQVTWESSREEILSVKAVEDTIYGASQAAMTAKSPGKVVVTACMENLSACCEIIVTADVVKTECLEMERRIEMDVDQVVQLHPIISEQVTHQEIRWIGTDFTVATLDREGNIQAYRPGQCRMYAIAEDSLSSKQHWILNHLKEAGHISAEDPKLQELLTGTVYAECAVEVREGNPWLRNLHVVEEAVTDHSILLLWNRASMLDAGELDRYQVYCNGVLIDETKKLGMRVGDRQPLTEYAFRVIALDCQGNLLAQAEIGGRTKDSSRVINVLDYGAVGDGKRLDTFFLQKAIQDCPKGGTVLLPEGAVFLSGALFLKSNMTFQVDGILLGSSNPKDYPRVITKWEGWRKVEQTADAWENSSEKVPENHCPHASLLNGGGYEEGEPGKTGPYNIENLTICGKGQINANGFVLAYLEGPNQNTVKAMPREYPVKDATSRGSVLRIHNGRNIYVKDVQIAYAPGWTVHTIYCDRITFDGVEVVSQGDGDCGRGTDVLNCIHIFNGDGIDPESCTNVNIFDVLFTVGDDAVAIKSGRGREGNELDKPNAYIRITDCASVWSLGGFGTGSETAAGSHDLLFQNLTIKNVLVSGIWLKTNPSRGGITEYIQVRDVTAEQCNSPVWVYHSYSADRPQPNPAWRKPVVRHLFFENVHGDARNEFGMRFEGHPECVIQDVKCRGISCGGRESRMRFCESLSVI